MIISWVLFGIVFVWLGVVTYFFLKMQSHYNTLVAGVNKKTLEAVLTNIVRDVHEVKKGIAHLSLRADSLEKEQLFHIQKIGLLRFNPFKDTGGDQSFILALLDAKDTGVVITALYSRSGTRWYAKRVVESRGSEHDLSEDEKQAIRLAQANQK